MAEYEYKFDGQSNYGWGLTLNMTGKQPAIAKRIFDTYAHAEAYAQSTTDSAISGLILTVTQDTYKNGVYLVHAGGTAHAWLTRVDNEIVKVDCSEDLYDIEDENIKLYDKYDNGQIVIANSQASGDPSDGGIYFIEKAGVDPEVHKVAFCDVLDIEDIDEAKITRNYVVKYVDKQYDEVMGEYYSGYLMVSAFDSTTTQVFITHSNKKNFYQSPDSANIHIYTRTFDRGAWTNWQEICNNTMVSQLSALESSVSALESSVPTITEDINNVNTRLCWEDVTSSSE